MILINFFTNFVFDNIVTIQFILAIFTIVVFLYMLLKKSSNTFIKIVSVLNFGVFATIFSISIYEFIMKPFDADLREIFIEDKFLFIFILYFIFSLVCVLLSMKKGLLNKFCKR